MKSTKDYTTMISEGFAYLLAGLTPSEIMSKMNITERQWRNMAQTARFKELVHTKTMVSNLVKIQEIENCLFALLESPSSANVNKRISALQTRYVNFLL